MNVVTCNQIVSALTTALPNASATEQAALCQQLAQLCGFVTENDMITNNYYMQPAVGTVAPTVAPTQTQPYFYILEATGSPYRTLYAYNGQAWVVVGTNAPDPIQIGVTHSDETVAVATRAEVLRMVGTGRITGVRAYLATASTSGLVTVDIKRAGVSVLAAPITIDANELTSLTATTAAAIAGGSFTYTDDQEYQIDVLTAGTGARGLYVTMIHG